MFKVTNMFNLVQGGLFSSSDEFDLAVRRFNQDIDKLVIFSKRNKTKIHHICLLQARENSRVRSLNKVCTNETKETLRNLCKGA